MIVVFYLVALLLVISLLGMLVVKTDAHRLASGLRLAGPVTVGVVGAGLALLGRIGLGGMLISAAVGWHLSNARRRAAMPTAGRRSSVRTAALEMELDHETGGLEGIVLAGRFEGRELAQLSLAELRALGLELSQDGESIQLLETYLDGRFPQWREDAQSDSGWRQGSAPASGAMSKQEAYQILGLEAGAGSAEIRKAHRRLMQRLHPDLGGSSFLAARINEAKEVLLSGHE